MNEITRLGYEKALVEMSRGESVLQAVAIIAMVAFVLWNIKLVLDPLSEVETSKNKAQNKEVKVSLDKL